MKERRLVFSDAALTDILEQSDWYAAQSGIRLTRRWQSAVASALSLVIRRPAVGAVCRFHAPELQDVRRVTISGFPKHLLFYKFDAEKLFVLRVVHGARDLERLFC